MFSNKSIWFALTLVLPATAAAADNSNGRNWAAACTTCHGIDAKSIIPTLAGKSKAEIIAAMQEFRDDKRKATVMHQIAKGYNELQIEQIAIYFSQQKP